MIKLTFNGNIYDTSSYCGNNPIVSMDGAACNVSDTAGNILFFSNGIQVGNSLAQVMENGDTLTDSLFYSMFAGGFTEPQTTLILPRSGNTFYLFYYSESDSLLATQTIAEPDRLYYAIIDMDANGGLGKVTSKKNIAYKGLFGDCRLTACRHANGRDWWLVNQGEANNEYFVYLITPDSVYPPQIQYLGPSDFYEDGLGSQSCFSPDGSKFATVSLIGPLLLMDFDRCLGTFSNPDSISIPIDTVWYNANTNGIGGGGGGACCFSSSGRFLYMSDGNNILQYDIWAPDVMASATLVGKWDSVGPVGGDLFFDQMYLLPNGQIIIDDVNGTGSDFHLIDSPDVQGVGCHFHFNGLPTSTLNANSVPNMINYRLGALSGSPCDTITGIKPLSEPDKIAVYPNPSQDKLYITMPPSTDGMITLTYMTGKVMSTTYTHGAVSEVLHIGALPSGVYVLSYLDGTVCVAKKVVKE